jgi:NDP-sugar pyrophosphorylase family protein
MILAAGLGTRLRPLTRILPKPLLPIANRPILEYTFSLLARSGLGVEDVIVNAHHLADLLEDGLRDLDDSGLQVHVSRERKILGTAGGLKKVQSFLHDGTFLLLNGDFLIDIDLQEVVDFHRRKGAKATMVLREDGTGKVCVDGKGMVRRVIEGAEALSPGWKRADFTGIHVLEPEVLGLIPRNTPWEINLQVYPEMLQRRWSVAGFLHQGYWREAGDPVRYLAANLEVISGAAGGIAPPPGAGTLNPQGNDAGFPLLIGKRAVIDGSARLGPGVIVGPEARVGKDAEVKRAVILEGTEIPEGERLENEIRAPGVKVPAA